ncbi:MAG TPA: response regulator transcription factor [Acidobacteriota bacterium]|nr:response regulator transcription factor [Acidobacteriota bacterium]
MKRKVLIVEDEEAMGVALRDGFQYEGYDVSLATDGTQALEKVGQEEPDLMILDVMLPKVNGLDVCKTLRKDGNRVPIIMLTARGQEIDRVRGLKIGADDYVTKPFSLMELMARVEALLRRSSFASEDQDEDDGPTSYRFSDVEIDFKKHEARKDGGPIELSPREFSLMRFFVQHRGEVVSRDTLLDAVWGYDSIPFTRTVDAHIAKLRKKIEDEPSDPHHIVTVHRLGYKFTG